jgi:hypothetical protein
MFDPMSELAGSSPAGDSSSQPDGGYHGGGGHGGHGGYQGGGQRSHGGGHGGGRSGGNFAQDLHSVTLHAKQRTFYIDLKQSGNGKFFKVSEKSRGGQKTTIMFDAEDLEKFIEAFNEMRSHL